MELAPKSAAESATEMTQMVLPNDANPHGTALGGTVMHWMDLAAAAAAHRHARRPVVTASVDQITFEHPVRIGQLAILKARVTHVGRTSMEITVDVGVEDLNSGSRQHTSTAYFTFVAIDDKGRPVAVPPLRLDSEDDRREHAAGEERRARRLGLRAGGERAR
jgi:acyl-CoA hydrolase